MKEQEKRSNKKTINKLFDSRKKVAVWTAIVTILVAVWAEYLLHLPWNIQSSSTWWFVVIFGCIGTGLGFIFNGIRIFISEKEANNGDHWGYYHTPTKKEIFQKYQIPIIMGTVVAGIILIFAILGIISSPMPNAKRYSNLITVNEGIFEEDVIEITSDDIITVDVKSAQRVGDRTAGTIGNSSWFNVDNEYNLISINGEEYRISPLKYRNIWSWFKAKENGLPGYVLVNAKTQDAEFVPLEEGMKYSPTAHFSYQLERHLHNQYPTSIFGKSFFEVDDSGNPYWITSVRKCQIGVFGGQMDVGCVITDAVSGNCQYYSIQDLPDWVDHVSSVSYLMERVGWHYRYANGFINPSNTNVYKTSYSYKGSISDENEFTPFEGYNSVITKNGEIMFYTGITPSSSSESNIGFVLVSPRTGSVTFYATPGSEEASAQTAAEGIVQNLQYSASFPTITNVDRIETYFMVLKDKGGLVQKYALCNLENYNKCVVDDTIDGALKQYRVRMGLEAGEVPGETTNSTQNGETQIQHETETVTGKVAEVKEAQIGGYTYYYFTLENDEAIYMSSIQNSNLQPLKLVVGAEVTVTCYDSHEDGMAIVVTIAF